MLLGFQQFIQSIHGSAKILLQRCGIQERPKRSNDVDRGIGTEKELD